MTSFSTSDSKQQLHGPAGVFQSFTPDALSLSLSKAIEISRMFSEQPQKQPSIVT